VINDVVDQSRRLGFVIAGLTPSPITGAEGNREFLLHLKR
jgi:predicted rRNA methylase YqxC with S4 and FtsJ domains